MSEEEQTEVDIDEEEATVDSTSVSETVAGRSDGVYREIGTNNADSADNINPRKLIESPHINDIRWVYRQTFAKTLVDKPVEDAFKHGFNIRNDPNNTINKKLDELNYVEKYQLAQKKARRDGFAILYYVLEDQASSAAEKPQNPSRIKDINVFTLDDLYTSSTGVNKSKIEDDIPDEIEEFETRGTGLVVNKSPTSSDYNNVIGYVLDFDNDDPDNKATFIHKDRCQHLVWNDEVDGDLEDDAIGRWEGESTILQYYNLMRGISKGNWSLMNTIFRYSAKLYTVNLPSGADKEDKEKAENQFQDLNSKSELVLPDGYNVEDYGTDGQLDPENYFEVIFEQICASTEMTKSVLFGTQAGTVSGSETDIKNYFNKVERLRQNRFQNDIRYFVSRLDAWDSENPPSNYSIEWKPMFKLSADDRASTMQTMAQSALTMINGFVLKPNEARELLQQEWADMGVKVDWDELDDDDFDHLANINLAQSGSSYDPDEGGLPEGEGGMPEGNKTASSDPTSDSVIANGSVVETSRGKGVVVDTKTDGFEFPANDGNVVGVECSIDNRAYIVALADGGSTVYREEDLNESSFDKPEVLVPQDSELDIPVVDEEVTGNLPDGWTRADLLEYWSDLASSSFENAQEVCAAELSGDEEFSRDEAEAQSVAYKSMVLGTDRWENKI